MSDAKADANPTKEFFLLMLTRDIELSRAILDLVDNSVDGARRLDRENYAGKWIRLFLSSDEFRMEDNCGGIPLRTAEQYAFRFGRPKEVAPTPGSIGQFGVGMKRALFKLGRHFCVESYDGNDAFRLDVDVEDWLAESDRDWSFPIDMLETREDGERGTSITVSQLNPGIGDKLKDTLFKNALRHELQRAHAYALFHGMTIEQNGDKLESRLPKMAEGQILKTGRDFAEIPVSVEGADDAVSIRLVAGVAKPDQEGGRLEMRDSGWYVFCNERMVLEANQEPKTGWDTPGIPKWHPQYRLFRGFAFLECQSAERLPWNTTKSDVVMDSPIYQFVLQRMSELMKPVIKFLDQLAEESKGPAEGEESTFESPNLDAVQEASVVTYEQPREVSTTRPFQLTMLPEGGRKPKVTVKVGKIQFERPLSEIKAVQRVSGTRSYREAGEYAFDYYYRSEVDGEGGE